MSKRTVQIKLVVTPEENEQIRKNAKACDRVLSAYIREMALNMHVYQYNFVPVEKHTKEISVIRNAIVQLIFTIRKTGNYVPADLEYILDKLRDIFKLEKELLSRNDADQDTMKKAMKDAIHAIVDQHLSKNEGK